MRVHAVLVHREQNRGGTDAPPEPAGHRSNMGAQRTLPASGTATWSMSAMGMLQSDWTWTATGDLTLNGTDLVAQGTPNGVLNGELVLQLPADAVPKRHTFSSVDANDVDAIFNISLHVLQVFRSSLSIIEPTPSVPGQPIALNVSETHRFLLFLENPGNGDDTFVLSAKVRSEDSSFTPEVSFTYYDPQKTLGALATGIGTVDVVLSSEIPALTPFHVDFTWTSLGGDNVVDVTSVELQAAPSHEWSVVPLNGTAATGTPGQDLVFGFNLTNLGNAPDVLTLQPSLEVYRLVMMHLFGWRNRCRQPRFHQRDRTVVLCSGRADHGLGLVLGQHHASPHGQRVRHGHHHVDGHG